MKVILQQDVKGSGKKGQLIEVSDGYARNFLLPRKLAVQANAANMNVLKTQQAAADHKAQLEKEANDELCSKIEGLTVHIKAKGGTAGRLFGSVTSKEVAEELLKQHNLEIDKKKIEFEEDIKAFGTFTAHAKISHEFKADFYVVVSE